MTIIRAPKPENKYKAIALQGLEDPRLSWKAKGILSYLLTRPDNWEPRLCHLMTVSKDGRDSTATGLNELKQYGYLQNIFHRDPETGQITSRENRVVECPKSEIVPFVRSPDRRHSPSSGKSDANNYRINQQTLSSTTTVVSEQMQPDQQPAEQAIGPEISAPQSCPVEPDSVQKFIDKLGRILTGNPSEKLTQVAVRSYQANAQAAADVLAEFQRQRDRIREPIPWLIDGFTNGRSTGKSCELLLDEFRSWYEWAYSQKLVVGSYQVKGVRYVQTPDDRCLPWQELAAQFKAHSYQEDLLHSGWLAPPLCYL